jgi:O-antigen/teichoic acid export membrane protein
VGNAVSRGANAVALLVVFKLIAPADFGVASIVLAFYGVVQSVSELGLGAALVQAEGITRRQRHTLFWLSFGLALCVYAVVFTAAPWVAHFYENAALTPLLRVHGLVVLVIALGFVSRSRLVRDLSFGRLAIADNASLLLSAGLMVGLAYYGYGPWAIIGGELGNRAGQFIFYQLFAPYVPGRGAPFREVRGLVRFGFYATGSRLLYNLYVNADYLIVGKVFGEAAVGIYTLAYRVVADPVKALMSIINDVAFPSFSRLQQEPERLRRYFFAIARVSLSLVGTALIGIAVYAGWAFRAGGYEEWLGAIPLIYVLGGLGLIRCVSPLVPQLLNAVGRSDRNFAYSLVQSIVMPVAFVIGAQYGLMGVAWAWVLGYPLVVLLLFAFGARALALPLPTFLGRAAAGLVVVLPVGVLAVALRVALDGWFERAPLVALGVGVLATVGAGLGLTYLRERPVLLQLLGRAPEPASP